MTFRDTASHEFPASAPDSGNDLHDVLREILGESGLPRIVASAPISRVVVRTIDEQEISRLTDPSSADSGPDEHSILERRRTALTRYLGKPLTCVLIHLPGARYTIEVDPDDRKVVYWEAA